MPYIEFEIVYMQKGESEERTMHPGNRKSADDHLTWMRGQPGTVYADLWEREVGDWKQISERVPVPGEEPLK